MFEPVKDHNGKCHPRPRLNGRDGDHQWRRIGVSMDANLEKI